MSTLTPEQQQAISDLLRGKHIPAGLGSKDEACSIAAINLALTGKLTDAIPPCMSEVIGLWIISVQDTMPDAIRNSEAWRALLPLAAGTGRDREPERLAIIMDWMWSTVLTTLQPLADAQGYGDAWRTMCAERSSSAAEAAQDAARDARDAACAAEVACAAYAACAAEVAKYAAMAAEDAAEDARDAARATADVAAYAAYAAEDAAWANFDPRALLRRLVE